MPKSEKEKLEAERKKAIKLHLSEEKVTDICQKLNRSRSWFYKWKKRYENGKEDWYKSESKAPKNPDGIDNDIENMILNIRKDLMEEKFAQIGAQVIRWKLESLGIDNIPSLSTINRIIKKHDLVKKPDRYQKKGTPYPHLPVWFPNTVHEVDFLGPKYITGGEKFYVFNVMDVYTRRVVSLPAHNKRHQEALNGLIKSWKELGEPDFIQFDNALAFRGSNRHPRSFGPVIKWCLQNGIQPIFIPKNEPWRNGHIEKYHDSLNKRFYQQINFDDFNHFCREIERFNAYHNKNHRYSPLNGRKPLEVYDKDRLTAEKRNQSYQLPEEFITTDGYIHVIRLIRSDLKLDIFSEKFDVPSKYKYEYLAATICTDSHKIRVHDDRWNSLFTIPYKLPIKTGVNDVLTFSDY